MIADSNAVLCTTGTSLSGSQPVYSSPPGAVMMNRRLVLKQLPSGQFTLTVQSLEPSDLGESSVVIADSQSIDTSTCSVTVESCSESGMPNSHVRYPALVITLLSCRLLAPTYEFAFAANINVKLTCICLADNAFGINCTHYSCLFIQNSNCTHN